MKFADLSLGQRNDLYAKEAEALEKASHIFLIARQSVQRLRHHDIKRTVSRTLEQGLISWP